MYARQARQKRRQLVIAKVSHPFGRVAVALASHLVDNGIAGHLATVTRNEIDHGSFYCRLKCLAVGFFIFVVVVVVVSFTFIFSPVVVVGAAIPLVVVGFAKGAHIFFPVPPAHARQSAKRVVCTYAIDLFFFCARGRVPYPVRRALCSAFFPF
nr:hypothetical protein [Pandoravirus aubagnensis]